LISERALPGLMCLLNPYLLQFHIVQTGAQSEWSEAFLISIALSIVYLGLYLAIEKVSSQMT